MRNIILLPAPVRHIYEAVTALEAKYKDRKFTPDGHMVGSIGEVIAAEVLGLKLLKTSTPLHDAEDDQGNLVQIKATAGNGISLYGPCVRLLVLRILKPDSAEIVYYGPGAPIWDKVGQKGKNGQHRISLAAIRRIAEDQPVPLVPTGGVYAALRASPLVGVDLMLDRPNVAVRDAGL